MSTVMTPSGTATTATLAQPRSPAPAPSAAAPAPAKATPMPRRGQRPIDKVLYPLLVAVVLLTAWQGAVTAFKLPPYLVP